MTLDRKELKRQTKDAMHQTRPAPYWVVLLLIVITLVLSVLGMSLNGSLKAYRTMLSAAMQGEVVYAEPVGVAGGFGWLLQIALQIMSVELGVGFTLYTMRVWRRQKAGCGDLFDGFGTFFRSIWITLLPSIFISLWSLVYVLPVSILVGMTAEPLWMLVGLPLLAPSIMASYAYRQATFIMLDNPGMGCLQCVAMSREAMRGHKWELFKLDMSFLGWILLSVAIPVLGLLLLIWVSAYMQVTMAGYYEYVVKQFMARNAPPVGPESQP